MGLDQRQGGGDSGGSLVSGGGDIKRTLLYLSIGAVLFVVVSFIPGWVKKKYGV
jgi:hypothetical protein